MYFDLCNPVQSQSRKFKEILQFDTKIEYQKYGQRNVFEFSKSLKKIVLVFYSLFDDFEIYKTAQNKY